jgi:glycosyltransferase involved in cell wall biosynthesis
MSSRALSIIIPAYNEGARIDATLDRVMTCVETQGWDAEVLAVDDGSQDDTASIVERWMAADPRIRLLKNLQNRGKGYSVRYGVLQAVGEIVLVTDADLSAPLIEAERLMEALAGGADVADWIALDGPNTANQLPAPIQAVFWTLLQFCNSDHDRIAIHRHPVWF